MIVLGASGSGKSSLLRAGLLYQLKLGQEIPGSDRWIYLEPFTPQENPLASLREAIARGREDAETRDAPDAENGNYTQNFIHPNSEREQGTGNGNVQTPGSQLKSSKDDSTKVSVHFSGLDLLAQSLNSGRVLELVENDARSEFQPIVMVIDQFEEAFTMCEEDGRKKFFDCLIELNQQDQNLYIIIGMRSDFRSRLREYPRLTQRIDKPYINVEHLNREEIAEAIAKPADWVGLAIEGALTQQIINDVEDYPGSLPLLQYTLTQLWNEAQEQGEQFLRLETYEQLGRIEGTLEKTRRTSLSKPYRRGKNRRSTFVFGTNAGGGYPRHPQARLSG